MGIEKTIEVRNEREFSCLKLGSVVKFHIDKCEEPEKRVYQEIDGNGHACFIKQKFFLRTPIIEVQADLPKKLRFLPDGSIAINNYSGRLDIYESDSDETREDYNKAMLMLKAAGMWEDSALN